MHSNFLLNSIGIQQWYPRNVNHSWYKDSNIIIDLFPAIFMPKCLVLLPIYENSFDNKFSGKNKILKGMLKVLELSEKELSVAKIYLKNGFSKEDLIANILNEINKWKPEFILLLDKDIDICLDSQKLVKTYHPEYLLKHTEHKQKAYKELLELKSML